MRVRVTVAAVGLMAVAVSGQAPQAPPSGQPTFRSNVTLVTTDVIPRDAQGRFVPISRATISRCSKTASRRPSRRFPRCSAAAPITCWSRRRQPTSPKASCCRPRAAERDDAAGRVLLVIVDDLHFEPELSPHVRRLVETLVDTLIHDGDMVAVVSTGPSFIEVGPTYDRKMVREAANKIRGSGYLPAEIFKMLENSQGPGDIRQRAQVAFFTAYGILGELEKVANRRKAVIYISTGYDFDPFAEGRNSSDRIMGGRFSDWSRFLIDESNPYYAMGAVTADIDLYRLMRELTLSANRANASLYTIDPRGLVGVVDAGSYVDQSEWRTYIQKTQSTLRYLAEETGGFAVVNTNDFAAEFKRIDAETSDYYVLGFYSTNPDPTRRSRQLEVKVNRPDVNVASRRAYSLKTEGQLPPPPRLKPTKK